MLMIRMGNIQNDITYINTINDSFQGFITTFNENTFNLKLLYTSKIQTIEYLDVTKIYSKISDQIYPIKIKNNIDNNYINKLLVSDIYFNKSITDRIILLNDYKNIKNFKIIISIFFNIILLIFIIYLFLK